MQHTTPCMVRRVTKRGRERNIHCNEPSWALHQKSGTRMDAHRHYHKRFTERSQGILVLEQILASKVSLVECFPVSAVVLVVILPQPASQPLHVAVQPGRPMPTTIPKAERLEAD